MAVMPKYLFDINELSAWEYQACYVYHYDWHCAWFYV